MEYFPQFKNRQNLSSALQWKNDVRTLFIRPLHLQLQSQILKVIYVPVSNFCVERKWWTVFVIILTCLKRFASICSQTQSSQKRSTQDYQNWLLLFLFFFLRMSLFLCSGLCVSMVEPLHFQCTLFPVRPVFARGCRKRRSFRKTTPKITPATTPKRVSPNFCPEGRHSCRQRGLLVRSSAAAAARLQPRTDRRCGKMDRRRGIIPIPCRTA